MLLVNVVSWLWIMSVLFVARFLVFVVHVCLRHYRCNHSIPIRLSAHRFHAPRFNAFFTLSIFSCVIHRHSAYSLFCWKELIAEKENDFFGPQEYQSRKVTEPAYFFNFIFDLLQYNCTLTSDHTSLFSFSFSLSFSLFRSLSLYLSINIFGNRTCQVEITKQMCWSVSVKLIIAIEWRSFTLIISHSSFLSGLLRICVKMMDSFDARSSVMIVLDVFATHLKYIECAALW